ncbi:MAG: anthranilate phosphoribosyltransferase [Saprospiraceae bacterium]|nr:anthranilate phosphoribosyltransferase [Saprospiraceae bacterium]
MLHHILVLDNFDSFTYNLVDFFRQLGCSVKVFRNTADPEQLAREEFDLLVLSPGPSVPRHAGNLMAIIARFYQHKPILGVCLGHQALVEFFGGTLDNVAPVHGKSETIEHDGRSIFSGLEPDIRVARYHSWAAGVVPPELEVSARSADGTVMAVRHKRLPIEGIQFHPESVLSMYRNAGMRLLKNVVAGRLSAGNRIFHEFSQHLQNGIPLGAGALRAFLQAVEEGQLSEHQKQILLVGLSIRLRDAGALQPFVEAVVSTATGMPMASGIAAVDICGTGGSGLPRINTSTLASLLLAHCGLPVAKHGNRAAAGRFGSFNLLEALGVPIHVDAAQLEHSLADTQLAFLFAPDIYPVFRHFAPVRAHIGVPTVFNVLGPLVNPLQPRRQFIGTAFADQMEVIFETGIRLGKEHLIVVRGHEGLDEISLSGSTQVLEYQNGQRRAYELRPQDFGLDPLPFSALSAANPAECLHIAQAMLAGQPSTEHYKLVAANAAFVYTRFVEDLPLPEAYRKMEKLLRSGAMGDTLERYKAATCAFQDV